MVIDFLEYWVIVWGCVDFAHHCLQFETSAVEKIWRFALQFTSKGLSFLLSSSGHLLILLFFSCNFTHPFVPSSPQWPFLLLFSSFILYWFNCSFSLIFSHFFLFLSSLLPLFVNFYFYLINPSLPSSSLTFSFPFFIHLFLFGGQSSAFSFGSPIYFFSFSFYKHDVFCSEFPV